MKIDKQISGKELRLKLEGRLDTNTAPDLEAEMVNLEGIETITFDFEKVEYISSSGLRLILKAKKMVEDTKVINCHPEVYEIFQMTGFSQMMTVSKAFRQISIENSEMLGEGFYGIIYRIDPETIVKVYKVPDAIEMIKREQDLARKAFVMGIPTAISYDIVQVGERYGAVFELLNAKSIVKLINSEEDLDNFAKKSAAVLKTMHQKVDKERELPSRKETVKKLLLECQACFDESTYQKLLSLLESIPETNTLLHCDFHVKNIMMQNDELLLIDMDTLSTGHPIFEFGAMFATYEAFACIDKHNTDSFLGMPLEVTTKLFDKTFRYYYEGKSEEELENFKLKLSMISYLQVLNLRTKYPDSCATAKEEVEFCINYLTENAQKLETLSD